MKTSTEHPTSAAVRNKSITNTRHKEPLDPLQQDFTMIHQIKKQQTCSYKHFLRVGVMTLAVDAEERYQQKRMHGISFVKVDINRELRHVSIQGGGRDHNMCSWDTLVHQVQTHRAEKSKSSWTIGCQKLIWTTVGSRRTRARNQGETTTVSGLGYTTRNAAEEGDRERERGGGRQALHHTDGEFIDVHPQQQR